MDAMTLSTHILITLFTEEEENDYRSTGSIQGLDYADGLHSIDIHPDLRNSYIGIQPLYYDHGPNESCTHDLYPCLRTHPLTPGCTLALLVVGRHRTGTGHLFEVHNRIVPKNLA